ncbi:glycosyltransferase family 4 protein [Acuticoccus sp. M5D2P5]|uniref:glycosyltransferase family 4 protein n=1 Tax=Acuticoccus kalidii TaxID=2910977 RepID=UPI001F3E4A8B|nr:glycosyltransferase family 4 protein [Acuticoccus kalidii]MCF3932601.1 glycosyltransferase family 4 protein [Acuticoccus kalidii]
MADQHSIVPQDPTAGGEGATPETASQAVPDQSRAEPRFNFHVDRFTAAEIAGWVADTHDLSRALTIEFLVDGIPIGVAKADLVRADVERAGRGPRVCGFSWTVPKAVAKAATQSDRVIDVAVLGHGGEREWLTSLTLRKDPTITTSLGDAMRATLEAAVVASAVTALEGGALRPDKREPGRFPLHERMFSFEGARGDERRAISPYLDFTHKRLRKDETHPLDGSEAAKNAYLRWYIDHYGGNRRPLRVPLGADEIAYLNQPVPMVGMEFKISRASLSYAMTLGAGAQLLPIVDRESYEAFLVWWCTEQAPFLHMEDCLVPNFYIEALRRMPLNFMGHAFAPSAYMIHRFNRDKRFHILDLHSEADRILMHVWMLLEGVTSPGTIRFLPPKNVKALFEGERGDTLFDRVLGSLQGHGAGLGEMLNADRFADLLWQKGFDITRGRFLFFDAKGNRFEAARYPAATQPSDERVKLQVIGPFEKSSGLGQASRLSAETIKRTRYNANYVNFGLDNPAPVGMNNAVEGTDAPKPARVNLVHLNGETVPIALAYMNDVFNGAYNIGYFFWELSTPARTQFLSIGLLDEIWVATEYGVDIYTSATDKPVRSVGMAVEPVPDPGRSAARAYIGERLPVGPDTFVFMATFDSFSFLERKNPHGLVDAFCEAFGPDEDVLLVLKTHNRDFVADRHQAMRWERIQEIAAADPRIVILNETMRYNDLMKLKKGTDCYVSLHRSEGWGFGLIEAMALGTPVLTTGYSGNMDFTKPDNAWLVDYDLVEPRSNEYIFVDRGQVWADPRRESAIAQLRAVRSNTAERERRAANALAFVNENFSLDAQARKYEARLDEIMASLGEG